jgi:hypothetical protein
VLPPGRTTSPYAGNPSTVAGAEVVVEPRSGTDAQFFVVEAAL